MYMLCKAVLTFAVIVGSVTPLSATVMPPASPLSCYETPGWFAALRGAQPTPVPVGTFIRLPTGEIHVCDTDGKLFMFSQPLSLTAMPCRCGVPVSDGPVTFCDDTSIFVLEDGECVAYPSAQQGKHHVLPDVLRTRLVDGTFCVNAALIPVLTAPGETCPED